MSPRPAGRVGWATRIRGGGPRSGPCPRSPAGAASSARAETRDEFGPDAGTRRHHRRRHRRQQHGLAPRPPRLARHRPAREGRAAEPGRLDRPRLELHLPVDHSKEMAAFTIESARQYRELGVYSETGGIEVARTPERMEELKRRMASSRSWGVEGCRLLTPARGQGVRPVHRRDRDPRRLLHARRRRRRLAPGRDADAPEGPGARRADGRGRRRGHRHRRRGRRRPAGPHGRRARSRRRSSSSPAASGARGSRRWPARRSRSRPRSTR